MTEVEYDTIIIGAGPAGLTASIYASCFHLKHIVIGKTIGGQIIMAPDILNYPGFVEISGTELAARMVDQAKARGAEIMEDEVKKIEHKDSIFYAQTQKGKLYSSHTIILATGTERRRLNVPGELAYMSKGVHYCATCERQDYEGRVVAVVGGANSAAQSAVQVAQAAKEVYILYRGAQLRCEPIWLEQIGKHSNIHILYNAVVKEIVGNGEYVTGVKLAVNGSEQLLSLEKVFVDIGGVPGTALLAPLGVAMDEGGFVHVSDHLETNVPGVFAAGDLVSYGLSIEQISTSVGLGARAAASVFSFIKKERSPSAWGTTLIKRPV